MRILVHVHTWNDADVIGPALDAIRRQTVKVEEILIVDNGSTDGTPELAYPANVTVLRHERNLGTSGAVRSGLEYARAGGYEWLWVLDADSLPRPNALELLIGLAKDSAGAGPEVGAVAASHDLVMLGQMLRGRRLTPGGPRLPRLVPGRVRVDCDSVIWSGALLNLVLVERIGLPRAGRVGAWEDLGLDYGDTEYTYRAHRAGFQVMVHRDAIVEHPVGRALHGRLLGFDLYTTNHPAGRRYLYFRNLVHFWLRLYHRRNWPLLLLWFGYRSAMIGAGIVLLERDRRRKLRACLAGIRDGLEGRLDRRFDETL